MANIKSFPNNQDEYIGAEDVMKWLHGRTSGVFSAENNAAVAAVQNAMAVTVSDGLGWMANVGKDGIVWWNDHEAINGTKLQLAIDAADSTLNRIDRIIVEWETTNYVDYPEIKVLKGSLLSAAIAPALTNNSTKRQISLARINVDAGTTEITGSMIVDERLDASVCGLVTETMVADTSMIHAQYEAAVAELRRAIQEAWDGEISKGTVSQAFTGTLLAKKWTAESDYSSINLDVPGVLSTDEILLDANMEGITSVSDMESINEAMGTFLRASCDTNNELHVIATETPSVDIPLKILCIRK